MGSFLQSSLVIAATVVAMVVFRNPAELRYTVATIGLTVLSLVVPGGRVLTIPFVLVLVMVWIFWAARRSAEREEI